MTLQELLSEKGIVLDERCTLTTEDAKYAGNYDGESEEYLRQVLKDFYDQYHEKILYALVDMLNEYIDGEQAWD